MSDQVQAMAQQEAAQGQEEASAATPEVKAATPQAEAQHTIESSGENVADNGTAPVAEVDAGAEAASTTDSTAAVLPEAEDPIAEDVLPDDVKVQVGPDGSKRVVRVLSVGQQVTGVVKRITDFGAFVDIGVGRDGLIHISELSVRRVAKVTDVLSEGQEVQAWIKKLDRQRNRISLTLIDPSTKTIRDLEKGDIVQGTVTRILPYGAFVDIGIGRDALLHVREMGEGYVAKPEDVVSVGETIEARIIDLSRRRNRVDLSLKGLRPEPAPQPAPEPEAAAPEPEAPAEDPLDDIEVLSPMELAFKRAMEAEGIQLKGNRSKKNRRAKSRSIQEEIIARTLNLAKK